MSRQGRIQRGDFVVIGRDDYRYLVDLLEARQARFINRPQAVVSPSIGGLNRDNESPFDQMIVRLPT